MKIPDNIKENTKNTVGYSEVQNKGSFNVGADIAFRKSEEYFNPIIESMSNQIENHKNAYEEILKDMRTLTSIITKYQNFD